MGGSCFLGWFLCSMDGSIFGVGVVSGSQKEDFRRCKP